jgi:SRSO17 transposase
MQAKVLDVPPVVTDQERADEWADQLEDLLLEVGRIFPRADLRRRAAACVRGLLGPLSRKNGWQIAEHAGDSRPDGQQHLLNRACWDVDELRDVVRRYVVEGLDDGGAGPGPGSAGVLVIDETGFAKKGRASAGVARQYTGALGGVFPCQVGVMAAWATTAGQALIDRELYLPKEWTDDRERCRAAHVPGQVGFATKPRQAGQMTDRILPSLPEGRVRVAADEVYGRDGAFRAFLEKHRLPYAVTVQASQTVLPRPGWRHIARLVQRVASEEDRVELPAGPSQAGTRTWQWWVRRVPDPDSEVGRGAWARWIIARRRPGEPQERDYYFAWGPEETPVEELVRGARGAVAGRGRDQAGQVRLRAGRLRGALLPRLVPAHHPRDARRRLPRRPGRAGGPRAGARCHAAGTKRGRPAVTAIASSPSGSPPAKSAGCWCSPSLNSRRPSGSGED